MTWFARLKGRSEDEAKDPLLAFSDFIGDLTKIEVNTLEAEISARKPPPWNEALFELAEAYSHFLDDFFIVEDGDDELRIITNISGDSAPHDVFRIMRTVAKGLIDKPGVVAQAAKDETRIVLFRIRKASEEIVALLEAVKIKAETNTTFADLKAHPIKLETVRQNMIVRKYWELGTNRVIFQSVMQLDGDVVSRVAKRTTEQDAVLMRLHNESLSHSLSYWQMILTLIVETAGGLWRPKPNGS